MHANICSPFLVEIWVSHTLSCLSNKSSYFLQITLHAKWHLAFTRFSLHVAFLQMYLGDYAMMLSQHPTCVSEFEEVLRLFESKGSWASPGSYNSCFTSPLLNCFTSPLLNHFIMWSTHQATRISRLLIFIFLYLASYVPRSF